jgi:hypothetical protein
VARPKGLCKSSKLRPDWVCMDQKQKVVIITITYYIYYSKLDHQLDHPKACEFENFPS